MSNWLSNGNLTDIDVGYTYDFGGNTVEEIFIEISGIVYLFQEMFNNEYSSYHLGPYVVSKNLKNTFEPVIVDTDLVVDSDNELYEVRNHSTKELIIQVGTYDYGDCYSMFVSYFPPKAIGVLNER